MPGRSVLMESVFVGQSLSATACAAALVNSAAQTSAHEIAERRESAIESFDMLSAVYGLRGLRGPLTRAQLTTTLTTKRVNTGGEYSLWRTDCCTRLLSVDTGGHLSSGLYIRRTIGTCSAPVHIILLAAVPASDAIDAIASSTGTSRGNRLAIMEPL